MWSQTDSVTNTGRYTQLKPNRCKITGIPSSPTLSDFTVLDYRLSSTLSSDPICIDYFYGTPEEDFFVILLFFCIILFNMFFFSKDSRCTHELPS